MSCKQEVRTIDGHEWTVVQMPPDRAIPYHMELATLLADVLAPLAKAESAGGDAVAEALKIAGPALKANLSPARFLAIARDWTSQGLLYKDGGPVVFESDFSGDGMVTLYRVLLFSFEVNFGSFLDAVGLGAIATKAMATVSTLPSSPPISTGASGAS